MKVNLGSEIEFESFEIEQARAVEKLAQESRGVVYSWKTEGRWNWLVRGFTVVDVLGLTVLPAGLPDWIDLPDDNAAQTKGKSGNAPDASNNQTKGLRSR